MKRFTIAIFLSVIMIALSGPSFASVPWHPDKAIPDKVSIGSNDHSFQLADFATFNQVTDQPAIAIGYNGLICHPNVFLSCPSEESIVPVDGCYSTPYSFGITVRISDAKHQPIYSGRCTFY